MIEEYIFNYIMFYILLEIYEVQWQKADTMIGMFARMYQFYKKSIFIFLIMHPSFYFAIWFMILTDFNVLAIILFFIKAVDIATKLVFIKQIFIDKETSIEFQMALMTPINSLFLYIGLLVYPPLIYTALV